MRRWYLVTLMVFTLAILFGGCKRDSSLEPPVNNSVQQGNVPENTMPHDPTFDTSTDSKGGWIPDSKLYCERVGIYSGRFVEDTSDRKIEDVVAMLISNKSDRYLDIAMLTYEINGKTANFKVTGLPAGKSAWVLESSGMQTSDNPVVKYLDSVIAYRDEAVSQAEQLTIRAEGNSLLVTNVSDKTLYHVYVYYKVLHADGNFLGGITYGVGFGDLAPGQTSDSLAAHYQEGKTQIVRVAWLDEPLPEMIN